MRPFPHNQDLLETITARGQQPRILGYAPDRSPIVAVKIGGEKQPSILISAGSHATEQAGVTAAMELMGRLQSRHAVYVVPTRDPIGLNGFRYALSLSLGQEPTLGSVPEAEGLLRERGEVLYDRDDTLVALIGEYGYANRGLYGRFPTGEPFLDALRGRRIFYPSRATDQEGAAPLERAYTLIVSPPGEILHLNRFHDTAWAPAEVRCIRALMAEIQPGLTLDLHEYGGDAFWMSARHQRQKDDEQWERRMAQGAVRAVAESGARLAEESYSPGSFFRSLERGAYWLEAAVRGEGLNLVDYAAHVYGPAFTIETGMRQPFEQRVRASMAAAQAAIRVFEERHA
jgi:hypothetical protein